MWFAAPIELEQRIWPTEDFEAAVSHVPIEPDEDDLFAGLGDGPAADELSEHVRAAGRPARFDVVKEGT